MGRIRLAAVLGPKVCSKRPCAKPRHNLVPKAILAGLRPAQSQGFGGLGNLALCWSKSPYPPWDGRAGKKIVTLPSNFLPTLAMLAAVFLWSSATPGSKFALAEIGVAEFVVLRLSLAAIALWLIVLATRANAGLRTVGWRPLVMGLLEPGLVTFLVSLGLTMTSPISGSVFWGLTPLIMPILGRVVLGERIEMLVLVAAAIAFGGTATLVWGQSHHGGGSVFG